MKKKHFLVGLISLLLPLLLSGQYAYDNGLIITKEHDTISCLVPLEVSYGKKIIIILNDGETEKKINTSDIKYLATKYNVFENVTFIKKNKEKEKLMRFIVEGYLNLYLYTSQTKRTPFEGDGGTYSMYNPPILEYVVKKRDSTFYIKKNKFQETIIPIVNEVPDLVERIKNKELKYGDLEEIIIEYNKIYLE